VENPYGKCGPNKQQRGEHKGVTDKAEDAIRGEPTHCPNANDRTRKQNCGGKEILPSPIHSDPITGCSPR
jgi:hypothetical protein